MDQEQTRFVVDGMLGSLARWLRILGYDPADIPLLARWSVETGRTGPRTATRMTGRIPIRPPPWRRGQQAD